MNSPSAGVTKIRSTTGTPSIANESSPPTKEAESADPGRGRVVIASWQAARSRSYRCAAHCAFRSGSSCAGASASSSCCALRPGNSQVSVRLRVRAVERRRRTLVKASRRAVCVVCNPLARAATSARSSGVAGGIGSGAMNWQFASKKPPALTFAMRRNTKSQTGALRMPSRNQRSSPAAGMMPLTRTLFRYIDASSSAQTRISGTV